LPEALAEIEGRAPEWYAVLEGRRTEAGAADLVAMARRLAFVLVAFALLGGAGFAVLVGGVVSWLTLRERGAPRPALGRILRRRSSGWQSSD
jgi:hypothetical protein